MAGPFGRLGSFSLLQKHLSIEDGSYDPDSVKILYAREDSVNKYQAVTLSPSPNKLNTYNNTKNNPSCAPPYHLQAIQTAPKNIRTAPLVEYSTKAGHDNNEVEFSSIIQTEEKQCVPVVLPRQRPKFVPLFHWDGTNGCLTCGADDDHPNLLICELCNSEYHTYCLFPPLSSVPEGDFYCDNCKPYLHLVPPKKSRPLATTLPPKPLQRISSDHIDYQISALPPKYTSRFGEIVWAAGGVGFGWWPACIYDPRLTVGNARALAKKHMGKKHLVYFFECHDAPFSVLSDCKICDWLEGMEEEYDSGRTARAFSKTRSVLFQRAMMVASLEYEKPVELRLDWNHQNEDEVVIEKMVTRLGSQQQREEGKNCDVKGKKDSEKSTIVADEYGKNSKRRRRPAPSTPTSPSANIRTGLNRPRRGTRGKMHSLDVETIEEAKALATALELSEKEEIQRKREKESSTGMDNAYSPEHKSALTKHRNFETTISDSSSALLDETGDKSNDVTKKRKIFYCKILLKRSAGVENTTFSEPCKNAEANLFNIGFISLRNTNCTFRDVRQIIEDDAIDGEEDIPSSFPKKWKFYAPNLGPMSAKQEKNIRLSDILVDTLNTFEKGSLSLPLEIIVQDFSNGFICTQNIGVQTSFELSRSREIILKRRVLPTKKARENTSLKVKSEPK